MRIRSFIIAYALVLAILLFADRRHDPAQPNRYSHVVDLTAPQSDSGQNSSPSSRTRIIAPDALIPGTWTAAQIPPERLVAPLVVMDIKDDGPKNDPNFAPPAQISLDDIAAWEARHGAIPQGAVVAIRHAAAGDPRTDSLPITAAAAEFLMDARYTTGFITDTSSDFSKSDRSRSNDDHSLARQLALHGNYVVEGAARMTTLPATGSLIIVAPAPAPENDKKFRSAPVRVLAMVR